MDIEELFRQWRQDLNEVDERINEEIHEREEEIIYESEDDDPTHLRLYKGDGENEYVISELTNYDFQTLFRNIRDGGNETYEVVKDLYPLRAKDRVKIVRRRDGLFITTENGEHMNIRYRRY